MLDLTDWLRECKQDGWSAQRVAQSLAEQGYSGGEQAEAVREYRSLGGGHRRAIVRLIAFLVLIVVVAALTPYIIQQVDDRTLPDSYGEALLQSLELSDVERCLRAAESLDANEREAGITRCRTYHAAHAEDPTICAPLGPGERLYCEHHVALRTGDETLCEGREEECRAQTQTYKALRTGGIDRCSTVDCRLALAAYTGTPLGCGDDALCLALASRDEDACTTTSVQEGCVGGIAILTADPEPCTRTADQAACLTAFLRVYQEAGYCPLSERQECETILAKERAAVEARQRALGDQTAAFHTWRLILSSLR